MDDYAIKRETSEGLTVSRPRLAEALRGSHMLDWDAAKRYEPIDPQNGRLRWLIDDLAEHRAWDLAWLPPALPQTTLQGAYADDKAQKFTKRLVFSGWTVVPKVVAALLSYEAERRHHRIGRGYTERESTAPLNLRTEAGRAESFPVMALLLPSPTLARLGDPIRFARESGESLPVSVELLRTSVRASITDSLRGTLSLATEQGREDSTWYAAAQVFLDSRLGELRAGAWTDADSTSGLQAHLDGLHDIQPEDLGKPPADLIEVLTDIAIAGPATSLFRSLSRVAGRFGYQESDPAIGSAAARIAWAFRSVVSTPEAMSLIQGDSDEPFWRSLLGHCVIGALGSVLDEWMHVLPDQERVSAASQDALPKIADAAVGVLTLPASRIVTEHFGTRPNDAPTRSETMRPHFAVRFGQARGEAAEGDNPARVRQAFNSPFWPHVLVSTSVGQEGLDFHHYAHAVVHWNLPGNPVDLEQREGRVHRYKNHAVRKNLARRYGAAAEVVSSDDPWTTLFELACSRRAAGTSDIVPYWIFPDENGAAIERHVPMLPMSREVSRLTDLKSATTIYRLAMGQPRQAELLQVLGEASEEDRELMRSAAIIDLSPVAAQHKADG